MAIQLEVLSICLVVVVPNRDTDRLGIRLPQQQPESRHCLIQFTRQFAAAMCVCKNSDAQGRDPTRVFKAGAIGHVPDHRTAGGHVIAILILW